MSRPSFAGFNSSAASSRRSTGKSEGPGPGEYRPHGPAAAQPGHSFKGPSKGLGRRVEATPGPGAYSPNDGRKRRSRARQWQAPQLQIVRPPQASLDVHSGVGFDTVGPGSYDTDSTAAARGVPKGSSFGRSAERFRGGPGSGSSTASAVPGPGTYGDLGIVGAAAADGRQSSAFASKVFMAHQNRDSALPGPGSYEFEPPQPKLPLLQCFGSTTQRRGITGRATPTPGPGAYGR